MKESEALQIMNEIKKTEASLERLKAELIRLQSACQHTYERDTLTSTCTQCLKTESRYY